MHNISEYLNVIGDFACETESGTISMLGSLVRSEKNDNCIIFRARIPQVDIRSYRTDSLDLHGVINKTKISLVNCYMEASSGCYNDAYVNAVFGLDKIVIGAHYKGEKNVRRISAQFPALNNFFMSRFAVEPNANIVKEYHSEYQPLSADSSFGRISVIPTLTTYSDFHHHEFRATPKISYTFHELKSLDSAIAHILSIRNLFSFLADGYIDISYVEYSSDPLNRPESYGDRVTVILNQIEQIEEIDEPFLITRELVAKCFQPIVDNWLTFYQKGIHIPRLFFEIITDRSKGINRFLNLAQAIEVYSQYFRDKEAKKVFNADPESKQTQDTPIKLWLKTLCSFSRSWNNPTLKHRLIDIFTFLQDVIEVSDDEIIQLAKNISNNRNFFVHYSRNRKEPASLTVSSTCLLLRYVIIALVYRKIGVSAEAIRDCKNQGTYTFLNIAIKDILENESKPKTVLE